MIISWRDISQILVNSTKVTCVCLQKHTSTNFCPKSRGKPGFLETWCALTWLSSQLLENNCGRQSMSPELPSRCLRVCLPQKLFSELNQTNCAQKRTAGYLDKFLGAFHSLFVLTVTDSDFRLLNQCTVGG